jgi:two-component system chemotaxis sensor kinase CheA
MSVLDEVTETFLVESRENLDQMESDLVALEDAPSRSDYIGSIFRNIHTLKGTCGFLAFSRLEALAHAEESLLSRLRNGELKVSPEIVSLFIAGVARIRRILSEIESSGREGQANDQDLIDRFLAHSPTKEGTDSLDEEAEKPLGRLLVESAGVDPNAIQHALDKQRQGDTRPIGEILVEHGAASRSQIRNVIEYQRDTRAQSAGDGSVRVESTVLDQLAIQIAALVRVRDEIMRHSRAAQGNELNTDCAELDRVTNELQILTRRARLQPISNLWMRLPRVARDLAVAQSKQVRLDLEGQEIQLDRRVLDAIKDPLTHLIRNAIDHGVELPDVRRAAGKLPEGCIALRASEEGGRLTLTVEDDGAGIDLRRVRQKALELGLIACPTSGPDERATLELVFAPGLSTATKVTRLSGRGVGMDVVKTNVERIGGTVGIESHAGEGTTVTITVPLWWHE